MQAKDLLKEIDNKRLTVAKLGMTVRMQSEKDTAKYRREKKDLARMLTILGEKKVMELKEEPKNATVPAPIGAKAEPKRRSVSSSKK